jgi:hypothetical protein
MPLKLKFNDQLLVANNNGGSATVQLEDGQTITVNSGRAPIGSFPINAQGHIRRHRTAVFSIVIASLTEQMRAEIREDINRQQKKIYDDTPDFVTERIPHGGLLPRLDYRGRRRNAQKPPYIPKQIPVKKPPSSLTIADDYQLKVLKTSTYNSVACLEVGAEFVVVAQRPFEVKKYSIGTIAKFILT